MCTGWPNPLRILSGFAVTHPREPRVFCSLWAFGHRNRDSLSLTTLISVARSPAGAERLRNLGHMEAPMMHPSPWGDCLGATAHVSASAWELMLSMPQVGTAAPTAPVWEGCEGLWGGSRCLASHTSVAQTWQAPETFSLFFNNLCIHPKESWHRHLNCLSEERRGVKTAAPRQAIYLLCPLLIPTGREANARCAGQELRCD